jgi:hypothetical protein
MRFNMARRSSVNFKSAMNAKRVARCRARQKLGRLLLMVECNEAAFSIRLVKAGLLPATQADDRTAIAAATQKLIEIFETETS